MTSKSHKRLICRVKCLRKLNFQPIEFPAIIRPPGIAARLVVVELKKPGVRIGDEEKNQCWKYVTELYRKGLIQESTQVTCFVLGAEVDPFQGRARREMDGKVIIQPLDYNIVIERAKSRLLKLYDRVKGAPFLEETNLVTDSTEQVVPIQLTMMP